MIPRDGLPHKDYSVAIQGGASRPTLKLNCTMNATTYCRRFNIAMIAALGLCALTVEVAILELIYHT